MLVSKRVDDGQATYNQADFTHLALYEFVKMVQFGGLVVLFDARVKSVTVGRG